MLLTRYELTINGKNNVGLIQGGYGLGLLSEEELKEMNSKLPIPRLYKGNRKPNCYFTEEGLKQFGSILDITKEKLKADVNVLEAKLVIKELDSEKINQTDIFYIDNYQWIIIG